MAIALVIVVLILAIIAGISLFSILGGIVGLVIYLAIAAVIGFVADLIVPGNTPYGVIGAILAGVVGTWVGQLIFGLFGLGGIPIVPAIVGAVIVTFIYSAASRQVASDRTV
jgi:uncharacterized membrane protein YeaQ/YmgE (transglycosylase-associated protein family)